MENNDHSGDQNDTFRHQMVPEKVSVSIEVTPSSTLLIDSNITVLAMCSEYQNSTPSSTSSVG